MNYIGSKHRLSSWLKQQIFKKVGKNLSDKIFCDIFAGTGAVSKAFKNEVKNIISNDIEYYSYVLNQNAINNHVEIKDAHTYIQKLNALTPKTDGFIYQNYCLGSGSQRCYFSDENGQKIDVIREKIQEWHKQKIIHDNLYFFLLASLLISADKIANTTSVYCSFLKELKTVAKQKLILKADNFDLTKNSHTVYNQDANELIKTIKGDILYLDPPYNQRQYGANYHILNTIAQHDKFTPKGKTGLREYHHSAYSKKSKVDNILEDLIKNADFTYIFLSYNSEGFLSKKSIKNIMQKYGKYSFTKKEYKKFHTLETEDNRAEKTYEYLHILEKSR